MFMLKTLLDRKKLAAHMTVGWKLEQVLAEYVHMMDSAEGATAYR